MAATMHSYVSTFEDPPGNFLARKMKNLHDRSASVFAGASRSLEEYDRFATEYGDEYQSKGPFEKGVSAATIRRMQENGKGRKPFSAPAVQIFNRWKIPSKLVDSEAIGKIQQRKEILGEEKTNATPRLPRINQPTWQTDDLPSFHSGRPDEKTAIKFPESQPIAQSRETCTTSGALKDRHIYKRHAGGVDSAGLENTDDLTEGERQILASGVEPSLVSTAADYITKVPKSDRRIIARALRYSDRNVAEGEGASEQRPFPQKAVEKWFLTATDKEREVARQFFDSVAGANFMGDDGAGGGSGSGSGGGQQSEQQKKLKSLLATLERERSMKYWTARLPSSRKSANAASKSADECQLRYLRLLSAGTRAAKWQQQTWHHLPLYTNKSKVENVSSHYERANRPISLQFTIHPDWGE